MTGPLEAESVTLDLLKKKMAEFAKERNWEQFHSPRNLLLALVCKINTNTVPLPPLLYYKAFCFV